MPRINWYHYIELALLMSPRALQYVHAPVERAFLIDRFLRDPAWEKYGVPDGERRRIYKRIVTCHTSVQSATDVWRSILYFVEILRVPRTIEGDVIEFGCFKGASTASLSIACKIVNRKLIVCDSFAGLPSPKEDDRHHNIAMKWKKPREYRQGEYKGTLNEVKDNIGRCGEISVCIFVPGYFQESLPQLSATSDRNYVFALLDVDLFESTKQCLLYIWPRLQEQCKLYTDDGGELDIAAIFFERDFWQKHFRENPPGLFGAGFGINFFQTRYSAVGLAIKGHQLRSDQMTTTFLEDAKRYRA